MKDLTINPRFFTRFNYSLQNKYTILFVLSCLFNEKVITLEKYKGQLSALRKGTLTKRKNTHHCEINNRWYDHEKCTEPYEDCLKDLCRNPLPVECLIQSIMELDSCNYNYAINIFIGEYLGRILQSWTMHDYDVDFSSFTGINFPFDTKVITYSNECHCCGMGSRYTDTSATKQKITKNIIEYFHSVKKGNLKKIPMTTMEIPNKILY